MDLQKNIRDRCHVNTNAVSYKNLPAHETTEDVVCRLLLVKKKKQHTTAPSTKPTSIIIMNTEYP